MSVPPLLRWGIENSDQDLLRQEAETISSGGTKKKFASYRDPELVEMILGKDDVVRIKEEISIFADEGQSEEARSIAFSNLDMMLVDIDQATNVGRMKQWNILIPLLASPSIDIRCQTLHILAICAQNNPEVQNSLATLDVLEKSFNLLTDKDQPLKHNHANFNLFRTKLDGFTALDTILDDEVCGENLQARIIFLVKSIMNSSEQIEDPEEDRTKDLNFDPSPYPAIMRRISDRTNDN